MPELSMRDVTKVYRAGRGETVTALKGVSLRIRSGELLAVVGPSGSGKTTLLRLLAGLDAMTSGEMLLDGRDLTGLPPGDRGMAMVFQEHPLFPHRDVEGNLRLGLEVRRTSADETAARLGEVVHQLRLDGLLARMPDTLSGGERQRVALGMALVKKPAILLLDEPLAHLDAAWRAELRREFRLLQRRLGQTWVHVTHDQAEALAIADRVVVLNQGEVRQAGVSSEIYDRPADAFVAGFVGTPPMNLVRGRMNSKTGADPEFEADDSGPWILGFRPESVRMTGYSEGRSCGAAATWRCASSATDEVPASGEVLGSGEIETVERMGHECWVHVRVGAGRWIIVRQAVGDVGNVGSVVALRIESRDVRWFEAGSGKCVVS